jgi:hypothetical protein
MGPYMAIHLSGVLVGWDAVSNHLTWNGHSCPFSFLRRMSTPARSMVLLSGKSAQPTCMK